MTIKKIKVNILADLKIFHLKPKLFKNLNSSKFNFKNFKNKKNKDKHIKLGYHNQKELF